ncbi:MAG: helix-turn-helix domain-containing protein [Pseudomonadota bacterium]
MRKKGLEISASLIPTCLQVGVMLGVRHEDMQPFMDRIELGDLETQSIDYTLALELIDLISRRTRRSDIGFILGETFGFAFSPAVSTYLHSLRSLRDLVDNIELVKTFFSANFDVNLSEENGCAHLEIPFDSRLHQWLDDKSFVLAAEGVLTFCRKLLTDLLQDRLVINEFFFQYREPANVVDYQQYLQAPLRFDSRTTGIAIPSALLDLNLKGSVPSLNSKAIEHMKSVLERAYPGESLTERIHFAFRQDHRLLHQPLAATAAFFNVSERTLQRKLKAEDITFFGLQEDAKKGMAAALMGAGATAEQVAEQLGFSDRRSFCRAFKRWFGVTPRQFRDGGARNATHA